MPNLCYMSNNGIAKEITLSQRKPCHKPLVHAGIHIRLIRYHKIKVNWRYKRLIKDKEKF